MTAVQAEDGRSYAGGTFSRAWPAWQVPRGAVREWSTLQQGLEELSLVGRAPVCASAWSLWESTRAGDQAEAVEACGWCPLLAVCREYALAAREAEGVWGGLTPAERRAARAAA